MKVSSQLILATTMLRVQKLGGQQTWPRCHVRYVHMYVYHVAGSLFCVIVPVAARRRRAMHRWRRYITTITWRGKKIHGCYSMWWFGSRLCIWYYTT